MNTFQLSCFLAVADTLNFARAAEQLNVTQPAVTHQIRSLETELNTKLFRRTTRIVELTSSGILFQDDARSILATALRAKGRFQNPSSQKFQEFSIGCHSYTQLFLLPQVLKEMRQTYPQIFPRLRVVPFQHLHRLLEEEEVDAIIGFQEPDYKKLPGTYKEMAKVPVVCVCPSDSPLAVLPSVSLSALEQEKLILNAPLKSPSTIVQLQQHLIGNRSLSDFYFCESGEAALVLIRAGFGVTILPDLFLPRYPDLTYLPVSEADAISFGIYYKTLKDNEMLKTFFQFMQQHFHSH